MILEEIAQPSVPNTHVVELGIGPGYMARHILERNEKISYEGVDFSEVFLEIAKETVGEGIDHKVKRLGVGMEEIVNPLSLGESLPDVVDLRPEVGARYASQRCLPSRILWSLLSEMKRCRSSICSRSRM